MFYYWTFLIFSGHDTPSDIVTDGLDDIVTDSLDHIITG